MQRGTKPAEKSAYDFVNNRRDQEKRLLSDSCYDPSTLYIPQSQLEKMKKMERQYWDIKRNNFDVVIFFKKGKFYELYDTDAELAGREFGLRMVRDVRSTGMMMSGVPEQSFTMWSQRFLARGYKVGRVEQMARQTSKPSDFMHRELVRVYSTATLNDTEFIQTSDALYVVSIFENVQSGEAFLGACAIDCSRSRGHYAHFDGPERFLHLKTFLYHLSPQEIIVPQYSFLSKRLNDIIHEQKSSTCFLRQVHITEELSKKDLLCRIEECDAMRDISMVSTLRDQPNSVVAAFWMLVKYIIKLQIDKEVFNEHLKMEYFVADADTTSQSSNHMILDCHTLQHLNIVTSGKTYRQAPGRSLQKSSPSLYTRIDFTRTSAGKRLLKTWVLNPLRNTDDIQKRQDCVSAFMRFNKHNESIFQLLKKCSSKDLERGSWKLRALAEEKNVMWVNPKQQGKKIYELVNATLTLASSYTVVTERVLFAEEVCNTTMARYLQSLLSENLESDIKKFRDDFLCASENDSRIFYSGFRMPNRKEHADLDELEKRIETILAGLEGRLTVARSLYGDNNIRYLDIGKDKYLIEVPLKKYRPSSDYTEFNRTAGFVRLCDNESKKVIQELLRLEDQKEYFLQNYLRKYILRQYVALHVKFLNLTKVIALIDALNSIAIYSESENMCCPDIVPHDGKGVFEAQGLFHPETKVLGGSSGSEIVRNDVSLDVEKGKVMVLTGPNMGGKSTLMRSIADACILAQIGGYVHASMCQLSPMDRIYTRIGAKDSLFQGKSTFLVELTETAHILQKATNQSLVLVDELGRGTSTLDGYAIAWGSLLYLANRNSFTIFSTHYFFLAIEAIVYFMEKQTKVRAMQMQYSQREKDGQILLMHKLVPGICSNSYGLDVARRAGISQAIIERAKVHRGQMASVIGFDGQHMRCEILEHLVTKLQTVGINV